MAGKAWTPEELQYLTNEYQNKPDWVTDNQFCDRIKMSRSVESIRWQFRALVLSGKISKGAIKPSPYPVYNSPLVMEGDAVVLPDLEFPFHRAEFVNRVLDLADAWQIKQCILAGDVLHFDGLSGWEPNWTSPNTGGLTEDAERKLMEYAKKLGSKQQGELMTLLGDIGQRTEQDGISTELGIARQELRHIAELFDKVDFLLGNHEGRLLRALQTAVNPDELLRLLGTDGKWRIAPYYWSYLDTVAGRYQVEHPKGAAEGTAQGLANKYGCHIIMGHSHLLDFSWDASGKHYAIHAGCCVDEGRLPYASQRHTTRRMHKSGAVIVRNGYPWLLHDGSDWNALRRTR